VKTSKIILIILSLTVGIGVTVFLSSKIDSESPFDIPSKKPDVLSYVPEDTILFFGGLKPAPFKETLELFTAGQDWMTDLDWTSQLQTQNDGKEIPDGAKFFLSAFSEYSKALQNPDTLGSTLGIADNVETAMYMVGAFPVFRIKLIDTNAFLSFVKNAEITGKVITNDIILDGHTLKTYSFDLANDKSPSGVNAVIAVIDDYAVFTLSSNINTEQNLRLAVGLKKPSASLADSNYLNDLQAKYKFHPEYLGFINHKEVMNGLTDANSNSFGKMLDDMVKANAIKKPQDATNEPSTTSRPFETIQTPECRKELLAMTNTWPRSVLGYTQLEMKARPATFTARAVLEIGDNQLISGLKTLQGFIPKNLRSINDDTLFGLGLGINFDAVLPFVSDIYTKVTQAKYQCEPLLDMQQQLIASGGPGALGMVSGMLSSLQGISASIFDFDGNMNMQSNSPEIKTADALLSITSKNPQALIMTASTMLPGLTSMQIPSDGTPTDFPIPVPVANGEQPKIAIKSNHLVIYMGTKAEQHANNLASETLEQNSWFGLNMDYAVYSKFMLDGLTNNPNGQALTDEQQKSLDMATKAFTEMDMNINETIDVTDNGIAMDMRVQFR